MTVSHLAVGDVLGGLGEHPQVLLRLRALLRVLCTRMMRVSLGMGIIR